MGIRPAGKIENLAGGGFFIKWWEPEEWIWPFEPFSGYEGKIKIVQKQWIQLKMKFLLCNNMKSIIEPLVVEFFQVRRMSRFLSSAWSGNPPPPSPIFPLRKPLWVALLCTLCLKGWGFHQKRIFFLISLTVTSTSRLWL